MIQLDHTQITLRKEKVCMATIRKFKGKWQVQIRRKGYPHITKSFLQKSSASQYAKEVELKMEKQIFNDMSEAQRTTLRDILTKYVEEGITELKSARTIKSKVKLILQDQIARCGLLQLRAKHVHEFRNRIKEGRAPKTINGYMETLISCWNYAKRNLSIALPAENPFELVSKYKIQNERDITITEEEYQRLLLASSQEKLNMLEDLIKFAVLTTARFSEIINLKRVNVDYNKRLATFIDTKNGDDRTIPLSNEVISILKKYPFGEKFFPIPTRDRFKEHWYRARGRAGLKHLRFHDLRSVGIRRMLLAGMQMHEVAIMSGHRTLSVLHRRYSRIQPEDLLNKINNLVVLQK